MGRFCLICLVIILFVQIAYSQTSPEDMKYAELSFLMTQFVSDSSEVISNQFASYSPQQKKSKWGVAASALVPGTGEMYANAWVKGAVILGVEIAFWVLNRKNDATGDDKTEEFRQYSNEHWDYLKWITEYDENSHPSTHDVSAEAKADSMLHTQQDYESTGKYDQFAMGWDDWVPGGVYRTSNRLHYESMRHIANQYYKKAEMYAMLILANHTLSALDAAWTISKYNRKIETAMRIELKQMHQEIRPMYSFQVHW